MFVGYPRSGHSLIGALLDAHRNAVVAHELGDLKYVYAGYDRLRLYHLLLQNVRASAKNQRRQDQYVYEVPGQWQGKFERIEVIGDKLGHVTTARLRARPWLFERLRETVGVPVRLVHVVRNPFDNISTMAIRAARGGGVIELQSQIARYFHLCDTVMHIRKTIGEAAMVELHHEAFIEQPEVVLRDLCLFLGLKPTDEYLAACAGIVYRSPHKSRTKVTWSSDLRREVEHRIAHVPFLKQYTFET